MARTPTYGAYPHLFWDLDPTASVNARQEVVLRRILERGNTRDVRDLVDPAVALASLDSIGMPDHVVRFWRIVFERVTRAEGVADALRKGPA